MIRSLAIIYVSWREDARVVILWHQMKTLLGLAQSDYSIVPIRELSLPEQFQWYRYSWCRNIVIVIIQVWTVLHNWPKPNTDFLIVVIIVHRYSYQCSVKALRMAWEPKSDHSGHWRHIDTPHLLAHNHMLLMFKYTNDKSMIPFDESFSSSQIYIYIYKINAGCVSLPKEDPLPGPPRGFAILATLGNCGLARKSTAPGVPKQGKPRRSPIQALTGLNVA